MKMFTHRNYIKYIYMFHVKHIKDNNKIFIPFRYQTSNNLNPMFHVKRELSTIYRNIECG